MSVSLLANAINSMVSSVGGGQSGGGGAGVRAGSGLYGNLTLIAILFVMLFIRVWIVQWAYNNVVPKLIVSWGSDASNFRQITLVESLYLTLLVSCLIGC
jgi:hypothetical protein